MRFNKTLIITIFLFLLTAGICIAADYQMNWWTVDAGGGTSTGGAYALSGTIGQSDAGQAMTGGTYSLTGGFWTGTSVNQADIWMLY